jgi:hypothetical protein
MNNKFLKMAFAGLVLTASGFANAGLIVGTNTTDWSLSTVNPLGGTGGTWTTLIAAADLPAINTYTDTVSVDSPSSVVTPGANVLGVSSLFAGSGVSFFRTTFNLFDITFASVALAVDNNVQVFINGSEVARLTPLVSANWASASLPAFNIQNDGSITDIVKFNKTFDFNDWNEGENEVVLAVRNLDIKDSGGIAFRMDVEGDAVEVPEPSTLAIFALGLMGLASRRFMKKS